MKIRMFGFIGLIVMISISLFGCASEGTGTKTIVDEQKQEEQPQSNDSKEDITQLVTDFGSNLQKVSLQASNDLIKKSLEENFGEFISPTLLSKWSSNPETALGRLVSSPWPDRIDILEITKLTDLTYEVKGEIIEATSDNPNAAKRPITLIVEKIDNHWFINDVTVGDYINDSVSYMNNEYGFLFNLPLSWKNYSIMNEKWEGLALNGSKGEQVVESGPMILIRHPDWTSEDKRQDIPIMVFTIAQWEALQSEAFHIGAAPIGPTELGRNSKYIFALPARYNFAFPKGYEEVENILNTHPLQATEDFE